MQADTLDELHAFAARISKSKPGRPENDHYDLTRAGRGARDHVGSPARGQTFRHGATPGCLSRSRSCARRCWPRGPPPGADLRRAV